MLIPTPGLPCSAAQAAGLAEGAGLQASSSQGAAGARPDPPEEPGETGLVLGKRHQRMFKQAEDEFLLKYWVRWALVFLGFRSWCPQCQNTDGSPFQVGAVNNAAVGVVQPRVGSWETLWSWYSVRLMIGMDMIWRRTRGARAVKLPAAPCLSPCTGSSWTAEVLDQTGCTPTFWTDLCRDLHDVLISSGSKILAWPAVWRHS